MSKNWSATDAQLLKRLREAAGVSPDVLAKRHTLSTAQVRELEGQDSGRFYTEDIKAYVGQRLLLALGHVPPVAPPSPQPAPPKAAPVAQAAVPKPPVPATEAPPPAALAQPVAAQPVVPPRAREIGRASCRERVWTVV